MALSISSHKKLSRPTQPEPNSICCMDSDQPAHRTTLQGHLNTRGRSAAARKRLAQPEPAATAVRIALRSKSACRNRWRDLVGTRSSRRHARSQPGSRFLIRPLPRETVRGESLRPWPFLATSIGHQHLGFSQRPIQSPQPHRTRSACVRTSSRSGSRQAPRRDSHRSRISTGLQTFT